VHLVGFSIWKFVMMHGHMDVQSILMLLIISKKVKSVCMSARFLVCHSCVIKEFVFLVGRALSLVK
jgi:hypothetical protein